jgi:hypothetical protein
MKRTGVLWIAGVVGLVSLGSVRTAGADMIYFKNGTSTWVEEANVEEREVVATRGGLTLRFSLAEVDRVEKRSTNMPAYRVDVPPPPVPVPAAAPGAPAGAPPALAAPGAPGSPGGAPPQAEAGAAPAPEASGAPASGMPGPTPPAQPQGGTSSSGTAPRGQIPISGSGTRNY